MNSRSEYLLRHGIISLVVLAHLLFAARVSTAKEDRASIRIGILHSDTGSPIAEKTLKIFSGLGYDAALYNFGQIIDPGILNAGNMHVLVIACGADYPAEGKDLLYKYLESGGAFFSLSGYAFDNPVRNGKNDPLTHINTRYGRPGDSMGIEKGQIGVFDPSYTLENVSYLLPSRQSSVAIPDLRWQGSFEGFVAVSMVGNNHPVDEKLYGRWIPILSAYDRFKRPRGSVLSIVHNYDEIYRGSSWAFCGLNDPDLLLSRQESGELIGSITDELVARTFLHDFHSEYAFYEKGESPRLIAKISNFGKSARSISVVFSVKNGEQIQFTSAAQAVTIEPGKTIEISDTWSTPSFTSDFYTVTARIEGDGAEDEIESAFVVRDDRILRQGLDPRLVNNYFEVRNAPVFMIGVNQTGTMWWNEDPLIWDTDFGKMRDNGIHVMRVLHFPPTTGGRPTRGRENVLTFKKYDDETLKRFERQTDAIVQLCQKYQIILFLSAHDWIDVAISDEDLKIEAQWNEYWISRYKEVPGILIDIQNEPTTAVNPGADIQREWRNFLTRKHGSLDKVPWNPSGEAAAYDLGRTSIDDDRLAIAIRTGTPEQIDGKLDDPAWREAGILGPFVNARTGEFSQAGTTMRILADNDNLYIGFSARLPGADLRATSKGNDEFSLVRTDDCIELGVNTGTGEAESYQIIFSAGGGIQDLCNRDPAWSCGATYRVSRGEDGWTGEIRLPFSAFSRPLTGSGEWRLQVSEQYRSFQKVTGRWSNSISSSPSGILRLGGEDICVSGIKIPENFDGKGTIEIEISGAEYNKAQVFSEVIRAGRTSEKKSFEIPARSIRIPFDLDPHTPDRGRVVLEYGDKVIFSTPWFRGFEWLNLFAVDYEQFRVHLLNRWIKVNSDAIRKGDPDMPHTVGFLPSMMPSDKILGTKYTDFSNMHYYGLTKDFAKQFKIIDRRFLGKGVTLGEFGSQEPHDARVWGKSENFYKEAIDRYMAIITNGFGLGSSFACQWSWKDMRGCIFPWGLNFSHELIPKDILLAYRNLYYFLKLCGTPVYREPGVYYLMPDNHRLGGNWNQIDESLLFGIEQFISLGVPFNVINEYDLGAMPAGAKILIAPVPYVLSDASFEIILNFIKKGGKFYFTGDIAWNERRERAAVNRFAELNLHDPGYRLPFQSAETNTEPVTASVGAGSVYYVASPLEILRSPEARTQYRDFLIQAGYKTRDNPEIHSYRVETKEGNEIHLAHNRSSIPQEFTAGNYVITMEANQTGILSINAEGKLIGAKCAQLRDASGKMLAEMPLDGMIISTDGNPLEEAGQLLFLSRTPGTAYISYAERMKNPIIETGTVENNSWRSLLKDPASSRILIDVSRVFLPALIGEGGTNPEIFFKKISL